MKLENKHYYITFVGIIVAIFAILYDDLKKLMLPFDLVAYTSIVSFAGKGSSNPKSIKPLIIPITFQNNGYTDGVITNVILLLTTNNEKEYKYVSISIIDYTEFIRHGLNMTSILVPFNSITIKSKESVDMALLFHSNSSGITEWIPGKYEINMFIKTSNKNDLIDPSVNITTNLSEEDADKLNTGRLKQLTIRTKAGFRLEPIKNNPLDKYLNHQTIDN